MIHTELEIDRIKVLLNAFISKKRFSITDGQKVCLSYSINANSVTIFESRSDPNDSQHIKTFPITNIRYFESWDCWQVVFLDEDLEWHAYEPEPDLEVESFEGALELIHDKFKYTWLIPEKEK